MQASLFARLADACLTTDRKQRLRITRSLLAANVFAACCLLQCYAVWAGFMDAADVRWLSAVMIANCALWYGVLRSGLNLRFEDPAMTLPQILSGLTIIVASYAVTGPVHGSTMMLLTLVLVFGIFNMSQQGAHTASAYTMALMGVTILVKIKTDPVNYPLKLELVHFGLTVAIVPTISRLAAQLSSLRAKLQAQKDELASALARIQELATRDELTGLLNRRHMIEVVNQHRKRLDRTGQHRFCLALIDLDHFKRINDTHGHGVGDEVLRGFAQVMQSALRETDVLARWGGEEFLLLLSDNTADQAHASLERARGLMAEVPLCTALPSLRPTFSAGLTAYEIDEALDDCIERADRALYEAKHRGRDRTVVHTAGTEPPPSLAPLGVVSTRLSAPQHTSLV